jgi:hypothetical protein
MRRFRGASVYFVSLPFLGFFLSFLRALFPLAMRFG